MKTYIWSIWPVEFKKFSGIGKIKPSRAFGCLPKLENENSSSSSWTRRESPPHKGHRFLATFLLYFLLALIKFLAKHKMFTEKIILSLYYYICNIVVSKHCSFCQSVKRGKAPGNIDIAIRILKQT